jgi:hypothetical protein
MADAQVIQIIKADLSFFLPKIDLRVGHASRTFRSALPTSVKLEYAVRLDTPTRYERAKLFPKIEANIDKRK